jgi:hypothetical protein
MADHLGISRAWGFSMAFPNVERFRSTRVELTIERMQPLKSLDVGQIEFHRLSTGCICLHSHIQLLLFHHSKKLPNLPTSAR